jgi:hypothetical protein
MGTRPFILSHPFQVVHEVDDVKHAACAEYDFCQFDFAAKVFQRKEAILSPRSIVFDGAKNRVVPLG